MVQIDGTQHSKKIVDELDKSAGGPNVNEEPSKHAKSGEDDEENQMLADLQADDAVDLVEAFQIVEPPTQAPDDEVVSKEPTKKSTPKKNNGKKILFLIMKMFFLIGF